MDVMLLAIFMGFSLGLMALDFYKKAPYLGVFAGITLILIGVSFGINSPVTATYCGNGNTTTMLCTTQSISSISTGLVNFDLFGILFMVIGVGVIIDTLVGFNSDSKKDNEFE